MVVEVNNKTRRRIDVGLVKKVAEEFLRYYRIKNKEVSIAFVGDARIRELNYRYRGKDRVTDVLAFGSLDEDLGEIIICYAQIKRQAPQFSKSVKEELIFILVHGLLHLLGHEDSTAKGKEEMERLGKEFIRNVGL